jgi:hypothetical protein
VVSLPKRQRNARIYEITLALDAGSETYRARIIREIPSWE